MARVWNRWSHTKTVFIIWFICTITVYSLLLMALFNASRNSPSVSFSIGHLTPKVGNMNGSTSLKWIPEEDDSSCDKLQTWCSRHTEDHPSFSPNACLSFYDPSDLEHYLTASLSAIAGYNARRSLFEHYVRTRAEERKEKRAAQKAAVEAFKQLLEEAKKDIDHNTDHHTFKKKWGHDPRFEALDRKRAGNFVK